MQFFRPTVKFDTVFAFIIRQYSLSSQAYDFWQTAQMQREETGSIFDPVPSNISGNIFNVNDPDELVLGYYSASAVQEMRFDICKEEQLSGFDLDFDIPFLECRVANPPDFCTDCTLIENSFVEFPEVEW